MEHTRFWLFPTYAHQQERGVAAEYRPLLAQVQTDRPPEGTVRLTHFAEVPCVYHIDELEKAWKLAGLHGWSQETVEMRFNYREPGLYVVPVRIYRARPSISRRRLTSPAARAGSISDKACRPRARRRS